MLSVHCPRRKFHCKRLYINGNGPPSSIYVSAHLAHSRVICLTCWSIPNSLSPLLPIPHIPSPLAWSRCQNPGSILRFGQSVKQSEGGGVGFSGKRRILNGPALPRSHLAPLRCPAWPTYVASRQPADLEGKSWRLAGTYSIWILAKIIMLFLFEERRQVEKVKKLSVFRTNPFWSVYDIL